MSRLKKQGLRRRTEAEEDVNPMSSMGNLADIMLVFACGLLLALIVSFNVDITTTPEKQTNPQEIENVQQTETEMDPEMLEQIGTVYMDPDTGKWYVKVEE